MFAITATPDHLAEVRRLLRESRRRFADLGIEDLPGLLERGVAVLGWADGTAWGFLGIQVEERPPTLPPGWPARGHLRGFALDVERVPGARLDMLVPILMDGAAERLARWSYPVQVLCYGHERWVVDLLSANGFMVVEEVVFFQLDRLSRRAAMLPAAPSVARLEPARIEQLEELAQMDAETFDPISHFGRKDLLETMMRCRVQVAWMGEQLAGYSALATDSTTEAQLARLAVHPRWQGQGIGRQLLDDSLRYAAFAGFDTVVLNTQRNNERSRRLYQHFGFRPVGRAVPVLGRTFAGANDSSIFEA
jgi:ribosomal-protein-alanine N-acetyltransferase